MEASKLKTRKGKFSGPGENCQRNVTDLAGSLRALPPEPIAGEKRQERKNVLKTRMVEQ